LQEPSRKAQGPYLQAESHSNSQAGERDFHPDAPQNEPPEFSESQRRRF